MNEFTSMESVRNTLIKNKDLYLANALLARSLQRDHQDTHVIYELGQSYLNNLEFQSAKKCFEFLKVNINSFESHYYFALCCEKQKETDLAKEAYLDALLLPTTNSQLLFEAYKNIGNLYLKIQQIDVAEDFYHKAYSLNSESAPLMVNLGTLELQKNDQSAAIEKFRRALMIDQKFSPAWVGLALSYHLFGDFQMAWASLLRSIECDSNNETALLLLAQWSLKNNGASFAINKLTQFFDLGVNDETLSLAFIELCINTSNYYLARVELERSLLWNPKSESLLRYDNALEKHGY